MALAVLSSITTLPAVGEILSAPLLLTSVVVRVVTPPADSASPLTTSFVCLSKLAVTTASEAPVPEVAATSAASASLATAPAVPLPSAAAVAAVLAWHDLADVVTSQL